MSGPSLLAATALVEALVAGGVRDVVLAPGSRSAPLAYAVARAAAADHLELHVRIDERSAGFLALGLAKGGDPLVVGGVALPRPVAVITTSGTAVANLHPAVVEAHHGQVPVVVLSADRPAELRGTGANQTTDQVGIFAGAVRYAVDVPAPEISAWLPPSLRDLPGVPRGARDLTAVVTRAMAAATGARSGYPGPVHLNLAFREPLVPGSVLSHPAEVGAAPDVSPVVGQGNALVVPRPVVGTWDWAGLTGPDLRDLDLGGARLGGVDLGDFRRTVVVAGDGAGPLAQAVAQARGWPLLAEPSSGAAGTVNAICGYPTILAATTLVQDVERVVVLGRPTLTRPIQALLAGPAQVMVVAPGSGPWPDAARNAAIVLPAVPTEWLHPEPRPGTTAPTPAAAPTEWLATWQAAGAAMAQVLAAHSETLGGLGVARAVLGACAANDILVVGPSSPARDLDLVMGCDGIGAGHGPEVIANRGVAGIDGVVSTALGAGRAATRRGRVTRALMGDLTFLHDAGGLLRGPYEAQVDLQIVVVNDDGGSIFATLEPGNLAASGAVADARTYDRVFTTPHHARLGDLCAGYGVDHQMASDLPELRKLLTTPGVGVRVIEVPLRGNDRRADHLAMLTAARQALKNAGFAVLGHA